MGLCSYSTPNFKQHSRRANREAWARDESRRINSEFAEKTRRQLEAQRRQIVLKNYFKDVGETERERTKAYRELDSEPAEIAIWKQFYNDWS